MKFFRILFLSLFLASSVFANPEGKLMACYIVGDYKSAIAAVLEGASLSNARARADLLEYARVNRYRAAYILLGGEETDIEEERWVEPEAEVVRAKIMAMFLSGDSIGAFDLARTLEPAERNSLFWNDVYMAMRQQNRDDEAAGLEPRLEWDVISRVLLIAAGTVDLPAPEPDSDDEETDDGAGGGSGGAVEEAARAATPMEVLEVGRPRGVSALSAVSLSASAGSLSPLGCWLDESYF